MNIWKPTTQQFIIICQIPDDEPRIIRGFDDLDEANQKLARLNEPTYSRPYKLIGA